ETHVHNHTVEVTLPLDHVDVLMLQDGRTVAALDRTDGNDAFPMMSARVARQDNAAQVETVRGDLSDGRWSAGVVGSILMSGVSDETLPGNGMVDLWRASTSSHETDEQGSELFGTAWQQSTPLSDGVARLRTGAGESAFTASGSNEVAEAAGADWCWAQLAEIMDWKGEQ